MSDELMMTKGVVFRTVSGKRTALAAELDGFGMLVGSGETGTCGKSVVLVQSVSVQKDGITIPVIGVDGQRVLYTFGENFGQMNLTAIVIPGGKEYDKKEPKGIMDAFDSKSVIGSTKPVNLKWAGIEVKVFITSIRVTTDDPTTGIITVVMTATVAPLTNKG